MGSKNRKSGKGGGISNAKRKNIKGGKMSSGKKTKSKDVVMARRKLQAVVRKKLQQKKSDPNSSNASATDVSMEDVLDMIDDDDLQHLKGEEFKDRQYLVTPEASRLMHRKNDGKGKGKAPTEDDSLECRYETKLERFAESEKKYKMLLPVKTVSGLQMQMTEEIDEPELKSVAKANSEVASSNDQDMGNPLKDAVVSLGKLVAQRRAALLQYKLRIGTLSAGFLEDPQNKLKHLDALLMIMDGNDPAVAYTVPKLCALSMLAVFRDVLPSYAIKHFNPGGGKLKKDTLHVQTFESSLLSRYKTYLKKLEHLVTRYCPRKKSTIPQSEAEVSLGEVALQSMCGMLLSHPYFNMSSNLVNFLIPFLNNWNTSVRALIFNCIKSVFRVDKRGEISYEIVRRINELVKTKLAGKGSRVVHQEVLDVLLALRIKEVDLEKEKEEEVNPTKKLTFEQRHMLSKRQRKKAKDLVQLEMELLEASAEENKGRKSHFLTEITKFVFTIYFRVLKMETNSKILSCVLEGLSKFAHVINIDFFDDILKVLERMLNSGKLKQRQVLLCISTVLAVLDGQGAVLTLDPTSFHKHLYTSLINLRCGKLESDTGIALRCVRSGLGKRKMPGPRAVAFAKRLATTALQVEHQDSVGILAELKHILRIHPSVAVLFDCDGGGASGVYLPELDDPDHSCATASTMWEVTTLMSHYHPWVTQMAKTLVVLNEKMTMEVVHKVPERICKEYNSSTSMEFYPCPPERKLLVSKQRNKNPQFKPKTDYFKETIDIQSLLNDDCDLTHVNFSEINQI